MTREEAVALKGGWKMAEQTYTTKDNYTTNYLTMARIMEAELEKWKKEQKTFNRWTGIEQLYAEAAYQDGFMAGFCFRFTGEK
jgi:hypothetical protein